MQVWFKEGTRKLSSNKPVKSSNVWKVMTGHFCHMLDSSWSCSAFEPVATSENKLEFPVCSFNKDSSFPSTSLFSVASAEFLNASFEIPRLLSLHHYLFGEIYVIKRNKNECIMIMH